MLLMLDALYPGTPAQLVANCKAVGAAGALGYVWHGSAQSYDTGGWSLAHFDALRSAGLITAPIASGTSAYTPTPQQIIQAARAWGFTSGPLIHDMEGPGNLPPQSWWNNAINVDRAAGYTAIKYGNQPDVSSYANGDGWWQARYIQQTVNPQPALPAGLIGWQYANSVSINGTQYDVSIFDAGVFEGEEMTQAEFNALLSGNNDFLALIWRVDAILNNYATVAGGPTKGEANALHAALASSGGSGGLTAAQAAALTDIQTRVTAIENSLKGA